MARITLRQLLDHAAENGYGVAAFNVNNMEQMLAIMEAAEETDSPVIIQASRGARAYANDVVLAKLIDALVEIHPDIPVCMHQDHGNNEATCVTAIQHGFTSVMMDGSLKEDGKTPADYDYNVRHHQAGRRHGALGRRLGRGRDRLLGSLETGMGEKEDGHGAEGQISHDQLLTDPVQAEQFVRDTQVDALAVAIGTSHGAYKFSRKPDGDVLAMNVIEEIHRRLPNTHLVMHGSSSVPEDLQEIINKYGGKMKPTWGVPVEEIQRGIKHGVRKINVDTDNRMAMTGAIRKVLTENPGEFDPRKYLAPAMAAMRKLCSERFEQFGTAGNARRSRCCRFPKWPSATSRAASIRNSPDAQEAERSSELPRSPASSGTDRSSDLREAAAPAPGTHAGSSWTDNSCRGVPVMPPILRRLGQAFGANASHTGEFGRQRPQPCRLPRIGGMVAHAERRIVLVRDEPGDVAILAVETAQPFELR